MICFQGKNVPFLNQLDCICKFTFPRDGTKIFIFDFGDVHCVPCTGRTWAANANNGDEPESPVCILPFAPPLSAGAQSDSNPGKPCQLM